MQQNRLYFSILASAICLFFSSCINDEKEEEPKLTIPQTYAFQGVEANTTESKRLASDLVKLVSYIKKGRNSNYKLQVDSLNYFFTNNGVEPSLSGICTPYYRTLIGQYFSEIEKSSQNTWNGEVSSENNGGVFGTGTSTYLFDENGVEMEQLIEKGLFGAVNFKNAVDGFLQTGIQDVDKSKREAAIDKAFVYYGAAANFPNGKPAVGEPNDIFHAQYAARRNNLGMYDHLKAQFLTARTAITGGDAFKSTQDLAIAGIKENWEKTIIATAVNYIHQTSDKFSITNPTAQDLASGLHSWGECVGFLHGLKTIQNKKLSDAQIDEVLAKLNFPVAGGLPNPLGLRNPSGIDAMKSNFSLFKTVYGFTDSDIELMKINDLNNR